MQLDGLWGLLGVFVLYKGNVLPCRIDSALVGNLFFTMGYYSKTICNRIYSQSSVWLLPLCMVGGGLLITTLYLSDDLHNGQVLSINACYFGKYPILYLIGGLGGIAVILSLSSLLSSIKFNVVTELSNGMIITLGFQKLLFMMLAMVITPYYSFTLAIGSSIVVYTFCYMLTKMSAKYFPALLGNRKLNYNGYR